MTRAWLFSGLAGLLLSSATPPPSSALAPLPLQDNVSACPSGMSCTTTAQAVAQMLAEPAPTPVLESTGDAVARMLLVPEPLSLPVPVAPRPAALAAAVAPAIPEKDLSPPPLAEPEASAAAQPNARGGVRVVISIPEQKAYVFQDGELLATSPVSTGKEGHETPVGTFPILQKKVKHRSNRYDNAPMPYMQRLTWSGIALHAGALPGYPASHGCIRLPRSFAKKLYDLTDYGTKVTITDESPKSAEQALSLA